MAFIVVAYRYSTSSDRVLDQEATWRGRVQGKSLATVMSVLRSRHRGATNIAITALEWRDEAETSGAAGERSPWREGSRRGPPCAGR